MNPDAERRPGGGPGVAQFDPLVTRIAPDGTTATARLHGSPYLPATRLPLDADEAAELLAELFGGRAAAAGWLAGVVLRLVERRPGVGVVA